MKKIKHSIEINTSVETVWAAIISVNKYKLWTNIFQEGSYFEGGWQKGDAIKFLAPDEAGKLRGMTAEIAISDHLKAISIRVLGFINDDIVDTTSEEVSPWLSAYENYYFEKLADQVTRFSVEVDMDEAFYEEFSDLWVLALTKLKEVCEDNLAPFAAITVETTVDANVEDTWKYWTLPEHVVNWNFASDTWHCPKATNDLQVGGQYVYTMAAKDGSMAFDFFGNYTEIVPMQKIVNQLGDGRMIQVTFEALSSSQTRVVETFEAENENTLDLQRFGWQTILDNFKIAVENKK